MPNGNRPNGIAGSATLLTVLIVVAVLYFARSVLIPIALALLLAFLLGPLVVRLRHWGLGRLPSVLVVVLFSFTAIGIGSFFVVSQMTDLAHKLPEYQQNVHKKLESIRDSGGGFLTRLTRVVHRVTDELTPPPPAPSTVKQAEERPVPVEIRRPPFSPIEIVQKILGSLLSLVVTAVIVIVFVIFMLFQREDLRDRLIRLAGAGRVNLTTKLLDDAAQRVSRYLVAQLVINGAFGVAAGIGLALLGVPNPILWGILTGLLRYIPYLGIWIAALMPAGIAFAVEPGWANLPIIAAMYFVIDMLMYNFAEPLLYGSSTGVSPMAILVAAVFWTWLWGPVGLLLATPLTVCVVVIGRHVPSLEFLSVLLSDEEVLSPETRFYQRMLAMDLEEATEVAEEFLQGKSLEDLYDQVIIPALTLAEEDRHRSKLDKAHQDYMFQNTRVLVEDLGERVDDLLATDVGKEGPASKSEDSVSQPPTAPQVICIPARDEADEIAAFMLVQLLRKRGIAARELSAASFSGESVEQVARERARVACVCAVPPFGYMHTRYMCRRLRTQFSDLKLVGAILTERDVEEIRKRQPAIPADELASSLKQVLAQAISLAATREAQPIAA